MLTLRAAKTQTSTERPRIGLALAGGGPLGGIFEIGALRAINESMEGVEVSRLDAFVGVSSGAFLAAGLANRVTIPQMHRIFIQSEAIGQLIEDPWLTIPCPTDSEVCEVEFDDPWFASAEREVLYYVRAIQEPTEAVNAGQLRCEGDECKPCYGDYRVAFDDDSLSTTEERAWSSPIYLH